MELAQERNYNRNVQENTRENMRHIGEMWKLIYRVKHITLDLSNFTQVYIDLLKVNHFTISPPPPTFLSPRVQSISRFVIHVRDFVSFGSDLPIRTISCKIFSLFFRTES